MARFLVLSSYVAKGHVGLRCILPALERAGHDATAIPTVILSSHAAYPHVAGLPVAPDTLERMADALQANGWLGSIDYMLSGYLPTARHVEFAAALVRRLRTLSPNIRYVCDPVLGDEPKGLYLPQEAALRLCQDLLPLADIITPNAFELAWLSGLPVSGIEAAAAAAKAVGCPMVLATSVPVAEGRLATLLHQNAAAPCFTSVARRTRVPSGTGDLLTGLFAGALASGLGPAEALSQAGARLEAVLDTTGPADDLSLAPLFQPDRECRRLEISYTPWAEC